MILQRKLPFAVPFHKLTGPAKDIQRDLPPHHITRYLLEQIQLMQATFSSGLSTAQRSYNTRFDNHVRREWTFKVGEYVFVDGPQLPVFLSDAADEMANCRSNKVLWQGSEPHRVLSVQLRKVSVVEDGIASTVSSTVLRCHSHESRLPKSQKQRCNNTSTAWEPKAIKRYQKREGSDIVLYYCIPGVSGSRKMPLADTSPGRRYAVRC